MDLHVLGRVEALVDGRRCPVAGAKPRAILTYLGLQPEAVVRAEALTELLWGDDPPRTAEKALLTHVSALRKAIGASAVRSEAGGWALAGATVDAAAYVAAATAGREALRRGDGTAALTHFEVAYRAWGGQPDLPDTPRGTAERTRWAEAHLALAEDRCEALLQLGRAAETVGELEAAVAEAPLRERRWAQLMLALYRTGRQGDALHAYQRARGVLGAELGVGPGPELRRLEAAVLAQDPSLDGPDHAGYPARAVTFLLTDIEGSTALWEREPAAMARALERHDALIARVVTSNAGRLLKTRGEGDSTFSIFERPSAAMAAAIGIAEGVAATRWDVSPPMRVRIACHTGEAELRDGDYFGRAVNRAARLRGLAQGGQILCSRATADLIADAVLAPVQLVDLGPHKLRDLARPEHVFELRVAGGWAAAPADAPGEAAPPAVPAVALPPWLVRDRGPLIGRQHELTRLQEATRPAEGDPAPLVLISGEPGIGKTRLVGELAALAHASWGTVLAGRCEEDLGVPYQPFVQALRPYVAARRDGLREFGDLGVLFPELGEPPAETSDRELARLRLFEAVQGVIGRVAGGGPALVVLDDLHWADASTLLMLRHLVRTGDASSLVLVGTYRHTDLDRAHPLAGVLADLQRERLVTRVALRGLAETDVADYIAAAGEPDADLARAVHLETDGNPFFMVEMLRHVQESGAGVRGALPQGIRDVVTQRLSRLSEAVNRALSVAAVIGPTFALDILELVPEAGDATDLLDALDDAARAGLLEETGPGAYAFAHALIRQTLAAELSSTRRVRLHRRVGEALEAAPGAADRVAALAHHFAEAAGAGQVDKATLYALAAGRQALERLAPEDAVAYLERGLEVLELDARPDLERRCELLLDLAKARYQAGDALAGRQTALRAAEDARRAGSSEHVARAALRLGFAGLVGLVDERVPALYAEALALPDAHAPALRARLLVGLARYRLTSGFHADGRELAAQALAAALDAGDPGLVPPATATCAMSLFGTDRSAERVALAEGLLRPGVVIDPTWETFIAGLRGVTLLEVGDRDGCDRALARELGRQSERPGWWFDLGVVGHFAGMVDVLEGRFGDAESRSWDPRVRPGVLAWIGALHRPPSDVLAVLADPDPATPVGLYQWAKAAALRARAGDLQAARAALAHAEGLDLPLVAASFHGTATLCVLAELSAVAGDGRLAPALLDMLRPLSGRFPAEWWCMCEGATDLFLALLCLVLDRDDEADAYFTAAEGLEERLRAAPFLAVTRCWHSRLLTRRDAPGDREQAADLMAQAVEVARRLGMAPLLAEAGGER